MRSKAATLWEVEFRIIKQGVIGYRKFWSQCFNFRYRHCRVMVLNFTSRAPRKVIPPWRIRQDEVIGAFSTGFRSLFRQRPSSFTRG